MEKWVKFLAKVPLLASLPPHMLSRLSSQLTEKNVAEDTMLFSKEEFGNALYLIVSGEVKIVLYSKSGREIVLAKFGPGDFFGEMSLLDEQPRSANAVTLTECTLLTLHRSGFRRFIEAEPTAALDLLREMSLRIRSTNEKVRDLALFDVYGRVAMFLMRLAESEGEPVDNWLLIPRRPTHQQIANMIGTSRETVSRAMGLFQKNGYISHMGTGLLVSSKGEFADKYIEV